MVLEKRTFKYLLLFLLAFLHTVINIYSINSSDLWVKIIQYSQYIDYILLLSFVEWHGYKFKELLIYFFLIILGLIITFTSGQALMLCVMLVIVVAKNEKYEKLCSSLLWGIFMAFALSILLYLMGISDSGTHRRGAIALGFNHPNVCGHMIQAIIFLYFTANERKKNLKKWIILIIGVTINFFVLDSRTTAIVLIFLPTLKLSLQHLLKKENTVIKFIIITLPIIIFTIVMYLTIHFDRNNHLHYMIDQITNGRLTLNNYNYSKIGFGWLGSRFIIDHEALQGHNTIDCSYLLILLQGGVVGTIVFLFGYSLSLCKAIKNRRYSLLTSTILVLMAGITENLALEVASMFSLIYLADLDEIPQYSKGDKI